MKAFSRKILVAVGLVLPAAACSHMADPGFVDSSCHDLLARVDLRIEDQGVGDGQDAKIEGFPYLRVSRLLASFHDDALDDTAFAEWVSRLRKRDREARQVELQNLGAANIIQIVDDCAQTLLEQDLERDGFRQALLKAARPAAHYDVFARALGLYPLTQIGVALGFERWKAENLSSFNAPETDATMPETRYGVAVANDMKANDWDQDSVAALIALSSKNALGIPDIEGDLLLSLAAHFAPIFAVEQGTSADQIGRPVWPSADALNPEINRDMPTVYVRLAHTRVAGEVLPQIVYTVWFPERPLDGAFDLLGGRLDGFVWRVTLGRDGRPLIYDSFHACGCYHMFFPVPPLRRLAVAADHDLREAPLVPRSAPDVGPHQKLVLHIRANSHYLSSLSVDDATAFKVVLRLENEMTGPAFGLRSITTGPRGEEMERRSLFRSDGIVPGTQRLERFVLWPMGIASAGAMRQWGTHATAFVGERHADDPFLFEEAFGQ